MRSLLRIAVVGALVLPAVALADVPTTQPEPAKVEPVAAHGQSDIEKITALIHAYTAALSARDLHQMDGLWLHASYVMVVNPKSHLAFLGWDAVRKQWEGVFGEHWAELETRVKDTPHIEIDRSGTRASATYTNTAHGKWKSDQVIEEHNVQVTQVYEKVGDRWFVVASHAFPVLGPHSPP